MASTLTHFLSHFQGCQPPNVVTKRRERESQISDTISSLLVCNVEIFSSRKVGKLWSTSLATLPPPPHHPWASLSVLIPWQLWPPHPLAALVPIPWQLWSPSHGNSAPPSLGNSAPPHPLATLPPPSLGYSGPHSSATLVYSTSLGNSGPHPLALVHIP